VSGLAQGSPVRYLGVDGGRVEHLSVSRKDPGRVRVVAEIDSEAPLSGATRARLGLLGLTGLLYIDLQLDPEANAAAPLAQGERHAVIPARKGDIEAFLEKLPDLVGHVGAVMVRIESLLGDENLAAVSDSLRNLREASAELPAISRDAAALAVELRRTSAEVASLAQRMQAIASSSQPELEASLASTRAATEKLARTAESLERIVAGNEASLAGFAGSGVADLQQLVVDVREASVEVRGLARALRDQPASLLREPKERGVEIAP
jgi:phospholipid/cholesterol/gamma-HCH transport system substrate-binding protein